MDDTDRVLRVTTPFIRPSTADLFETVTAETRQSAFDEPVTFDDPTPTTAPSWAPRRRLARGTMVPPTIPTLPGLKSARAARAPRTVQRPSLDATAGLDIAYVDSPREWGYVIRIDLRPRLAAVSGEVTAPVRRIDTGAAWGPLVGGLVATLLLAAALVLTRGGGGDDRGAPTAPAPGPVAALAPAPVPVAPAEPIVTPIVIQLEDRSADADDTEIEMPVETVGHAAAAPAASANHAILMIGSKPPCRIFVDGKDTGLTTPQRAVRVAAGRRTITLRNDALGIRHSSTVNVAGGRKAKLIRDLTAQLTE